MKKGGFLLLKKKFMLVTVIWFFVSLSVLAGYCYTSIVKQNAKQEAFLVMENLVFPDVDKIIKNLKLEDAFVNKVMQKQELITMEVELSQEVEWDDSWTENLFSKKQRITFFSTGKYSTDLNTMTAEDVSYNHEQEIIRLSIQKPEISSIEIDEMKTLIERTETGIFRFGEISLTSTEHNQILLAAKNQMRDAMLEEKLMKQAEENTIRSVQALYTDFLQASGFGNYKIQIDWK